MKRRSKAVSGCVLFPVKSKKWANTKEGGMIVKMVVVHKKSKMEVCCGATVNDILKESLVGDDLRKKPEELDEHVSVKSLLAEQKELERWEGYHFPRLSAKGFKGVERHVSRNYVAALVLGATGWSGWSEDRLRYWECRPKDLSPEGRKLYKMTKKMYAGCDVHLFTFLDT